MRDVEKAINYLTPIAESAKVGQYGVMLKIAIQECEKQMSKKPIWNYDDEFICPTCGETTEDYDVTTIKFCPECGQKLDWSDNNVKTTD